MIEYKVILGVIAIVVGFIAYVPYFRDIFKGKTKPHPFSWATWGVIETIAFLAQVSEGAGAGAWVTGVSAIIVFTVAILALKNREKQITKSDIAALAGAIIGITLWRVTNNPLLAVISVSIADALAFFPTYRKSFYRPNEETLIEFGLSALKWVIAIPALESLNLTTWLYPASLIVTNSAFVIMVMTRRLHFKRQTENNLGSH